MRRKRHKRNFEDSDASAELFLRAICGYFPFLDFMIYPFYSVSEPQRYEPDQLKKKNHPKKPS